MKELSEVLETEASESISSPELALPRETPLFYDLDLSSDPQLSPEDQLLPWSQAELDPKQVFTKEEAKQSAETIAASQNSDKPSRDPETPQSSGTEPKSKMEGREARVTSWDNGGQVNCKPSTLSPYSNKTFLTTGSKRSRRKANSKVLGRSPLTILQDDNSPGTLTLRQVKEEGGENCHQVSVMGWRDVSAIKSTSCSSRGLGFNFQQPHSGPQPLYKGSDAFCHAAIHANRAFIRINKKEYPSLKWEAAFPSSCLCLPHSTPLAPQLMSCLLQGKRPSALSENVKDLKEGVVLGTGRFLKAGGGAREPNQDHDKENQHFALLES